ncbi:MAG: hypothetical protein SGI86_01385 [Deltaproteobacteria bacterium]|nr:hypothetical protein [Deltaproteobacteria bacterium]
MVKSFAVSVCLAGFLGTLACSQEGATDADQHEVFFEGFVYDGASGQRLVSPALKAVTLTFGTNVIPTLIGPDGRFVTQKPLPTWQDYTVSIEAMGYRKFASYNLGIDIPASLRMTDGIAQSATKQTFHIDAQLFPDALQSAALTLTVGHEDDFSAMPPPLPAAGVARFRPQAVSLIERSVMTAQPPRWLNHEDLLTRTVVKIFDGGKISLAQNELVYGVSYELTIYGVPNYQPLVLSGQQGITAGAVSSQTIQLAKEARDALRIVSINDDACMPPAGSATDFLGAISIRFSDQVEFVGESWAEDFDNGLSITPMAYAGAFYYCPLFTNVSPTKQERGTRVTVANDTITLAFNPSVGINPALVTACTIPPQLTLVAYSIPPSTMVQPKGDSSRKRTLYALITDYMSKAGLNFSQTLRCQ